MITGICIECGQHEITSYDGRGCVNAHCSSCVLGPKRKAEAMLREDQERKKLLKLFKEPKIDIETKVSRYEKWNVIKNIMDIPYDFRTNEEYKIQCLVEAYAQCPISERWYSKWVDCSNDLNNRLNIKNHVKEGIFYRYKKEIKMTDKEEAIKLVKEAKENLERCEKLLEKTMKPESYPCATPITSGTERNSIVFNNGKQALFVNKGIYGVDTTYGSFRNTAEDFVWIPCERNNLEVGDVAYRTDYKDHVFTDLQDVCVILDKKQFVYVSSQSIYIGGSNPMCWYKLVRKEDL